MTDDHPFFRLVWRLNALVILGVALVIGSVVSLQIARDLLRSRTAYRAPDRGIETPAAAPEGRAPDTPRESLLVGAFTRADGPIFQAPLYRGRAYDLGKYVSGYKGRELVHNVVFFDSRTGALRRLLSDDSGRILDEETVTRRDPGSESRPLARLYVYVPADSNGDGQLDPRDRQRVVVTRPDGSGSVVLADGVDHYMTAAATGEGDRTLAYFVRRGGDLHYGEFDLQTFEAKRTVPVPLPRT